MEVNPALDSRAIALSGKVVALTAIEPTANRDNPMATRLRESDPTALQALWQEYGDTVLAVAMRRLGDRAAAEDVRQQVFAEIWERRDTYDPERGPVRAWVLTIARSRSIDHLRRRGAATTDPGTMERLPAATDPEETPEAVVDRIGIADMLRRIPTDEAGFLRMRFYDGLSQTEIAERTGIPLGTVKMRMVRALDRMREMLDSEGGER